MANPLRWFRQHQKIMMVFFGVGLMAVFGLGSVVSMINPSDIGVTRENPVIATWKGGEIKRDFLDSMRFRHFQTMRFLEGLQVAASKEKGEGFQSLAIPISPIVQGEYNADDVDRRLLDKYLMAQLAKEEGIVVDDYMVDEYLAQVRGYVPMSRNDMAAINREANQGQAAMEVVRRHLKVELAAQQMNGLVSVGIAGSNPNVPRTPNPTDAIELYAKTSRRIECQILPIEVDPDAITETPTTSELTRIYNEGKYTYAQFDGKTPGFKIGKKVKVQYFIANTDNFLQNEINKLTDAEVQAEYDKLVEQESPLVMEVIPDVEQPEIPAETEDGAPGMIEDGDSDDAPPLVPEGILGDEESTESTEESTEGSSEESGEGGLSLRVNQTKPQFVSTMIQEEGEEPSESEPAETEPAETQEESPAKTESPAESSEAQTEPTEQPAETTEEPAVESEEPAVEAEEPMTEEEAANQDDAAPALESGDANAEKAEDASPIQLPQLAEEKEIKKRPKKLADCAQEIKESMKRKDAMNSVKDALDRADAEIGTFKMRYTRWKFGDEDKRGEEPTAPDFKAIADKYNLEFNETDLVDINDLLETEIGKVTVFKQVMGQGGRPQAIFPALGELIFDNFQDTNEYDPARESDMTGTYSFWVAEKAEARIPEFTEVKSTVEEFWKKGKAIEAAMEKGKEIAATVGPEKTLVGLNAEKAISTGEFTWFTTMGGQPRISSPVGTTDVGEEFMQTAFGLKQYESGVAPNAPHDTVYVIQLVSEKATMAESGQDYLENQYFKFKRVPADVRNVSMWYTLDLYRDWNTEFAEKMELELVGQ